jgi:hypothetical protein
MSKFIPRKFLVPLFAFIVLDLFAVRAIMGVPIFAILLGFVAGWFTLPILISAAPHFRQLLRICLTAAFLTSSFSLLLMLIIREPVTRMLLDPPADFANF